MFFINLDFFQVILICVFFFNHGIHHHFSPPFGSEYLWFTFSIRIVAINFRRGTSFRNLQSWTPSLTYLPVLGVRFGCFFLPVYLSYLSVYLRHHWKIRLVAWYLTLCFSVSFQIGFYQKKKTVRFPFPSRFFLKLSASFLVKL